MKRGYICKAVLNPNYIMFIGCPFGLYHVFVKSGGHVYSVYGGYKHLGTAENRLIKSAASYHSNPVKYTTMTKSQLLQEGVQV